MQIMEMEDTVCLLSLMSRDLDGHKERDTDGDEK